MNRISFPLARLGSALLAAAAVSLSGGASAQTTLGNQPWNASWVVPGNVALTLSVEYPTAVSNTHIDTTYAATSTYIGYFDPAKCYTYTYNATETSRYFQPAGNASSHVCSGKWSGNFLNWATMQTIDPFRWALTGGYRTTDTTTTTIIEKAYATGQGTTSEFPDRTVSGSTLIKGATPLSWSTLKLRIQGLGNKMWFTGSGNNNSVSSANALGSTSGSGKNAVTYDGSDNSVVYEVSARVRVCDSTSGTGDLESNCVKYPSGYYKPEGLIQKYNQKIRFSAFGYLNDATLTRDGGVMRARMKYVGPTQPVPGSDAITNSGAEWDATTGIVTINPDSSDASATATAYGISISNSGVMNYVNKFGEITPGTYKSYDPVSELYYAALRYYRNLGNVAEWSNPGTSTSTATKTTYADGFPVITSWDDPIIYSCQKNFILGIGDVNTHADRNLPGATGKSEPTKPAAVSADTTLDTVAWTNRVGVLGGLGSSLGTTSPYNSCCNNNGALIAGMAYYAHTQDIRADLDNVQTIKTYWLDVLEYQAYKTNNQFYLATKFGGFTVPSTYTDASASADTFTNNVTMWHSGGDSDTVGGQPRPDTYYTAAKADQMVTGLSSAFASIASDVSGYASSLNTATDEIAVGTQSYGATYETSGWTGDIEAKTVADPSTDPLTYNANAWVFGTRLSTQMGSDGTGWDTKRNIVTYNTTTKAGIPFRLANLTTAQTTALDPTYTTTSDASDYLKYLRGDQTNEQLSTASGSTQLYRARSATKLMGDVINASVLVVGPPASPATSLSEASNPGYTAHWQKYGASGTSPRPNILVAGANDGMVHVINGSFDTTGSGGYELFAYIPSPVITGPSGTPSVDGLAGLGNPTYTHYYRVDAKPTSAEVDFKSTAGSTLTANDWHTLVVGGLGKGGKSIYALDVTTATSVSSETVAATKVLWEYTEADMGYTFGTPIITKTAQYGWVVIFGSGMNNSSGLGYFYILNARTGALLQKVALPTTGGTAAMDNGTATSPTGLSYLYSFYRDKTTSVIETVYAGDLHGNLWRLDLTATSGTYPTPVKIAKLTNAAGAELPVTSAPTPTIDSNGRRWIGVATGQLLNTTDVNTTTLNRVFAIRDGYETRYGLSTDLPAGVSWPIMDNSTRHDLLDISTVTQALTTSQAGYFVDMYTKIGGAGYRNIINGDALGNYLVYVPTLPKSDDACNGSGTSAEILINLADGSVTATKINWLVTEVRFVTVTGTNNKTWIGIALQGKPGTDGKGDVVNTLPDGATGSKRLINWREIPLRN